MDTVFGLTNASSSIFHVSIYILLNTIKLFQYIYNIIFILDNKYERQAMGKNGVHTLKNVAVVHDKMLDGYSVNGNITPYKRFNTQTLLT